jgi:hypothetical protein
MTMRGRPAWWNDSRDAELAARWEAGQSYETIAAALGCTPTAAQVRKGIVGAYRAPGFKRTRRPRSVVHQQVAGRHFQGVA